MATAGHRKAKANWWDHETERSGPLKDVDTVFLRGDAASRDIPLSRPITQTEQNTNPYKPKYTQVARPGFKWIRTSVNGPQRWIEVPIDAAPATRNKRLHNVKLAEVMERISQL